MKKGDKACTFVFMPNQYRVYKAIFESGIKGSGRLVQLLKRICLPAMQSGMVITTLYGFKIKIDPVKDKGIERTLYHSGSYEEGTLNVLGNILKKGDCFVDAGANIGLMSLFVAHKLKDDCSIVAFEPHPVTAAILRENIAINQFSSIRVEPFALGNAAGTGSIYDRWEVNRGGSSLIAPPHEGDKYPVQVTTLDSCFADDFPIDVIKMDVEGFELYALQGAAAILRRKQPPMLVLEYSMLTGNGENDPHALYHYIKSFGHYRIFRSKQWKIVADKHVEVITVEDLPQHDSIYCFTSSHIGQLPPSLFENSPQA